MLSEDFKKYIILNIFSYIQLLAIYSSIYATKNSEKDQFKYIYYISKILIIKSLIIENHYSKILFNFSNSDIPITYSSYRNLFKLVKNENGCMSSYKHCRF